MIARIRREKPAFEAAPVFRFLLTQAPSGQNVLFFLLLLEYILLNIQTSTRTIKFLGISPAGER